MTKTRTQSTDRHRTASDALAALGREAAEHRRLTVQCPRSHHVAVVYETDAGLVFRALTGPHAHGSKDYVDTGHRTGGHGVEYVDLLTSTPTSQDELPAWCDCGPRHLSRSALLRAIRGGTRTLHLT